MKLAIPVLCGLVLATACAAGPEYRPALTDDDQGYSSSMIDTGRYRVSYTGDSGQSASEVQNLALLRAAEVTLDNGGDWFEIITDNTSGDVRTRKRLADQGVNTMPELRRDCGVLGCTTRGFPVSVRDSDIESETRVVYDHTMEILIHQGTKPPNTPTAYDARETAANLRTTIN